MLTSQQMTSSKQRKIFTVARLNQEVQSLLERGFGTVWLQAELSNLSTPASGHWYFSLKDSQAQIRCAMFRGRNRYLTFKPTAGDEVLVRGKLGLYAARGDYQLIVEHMEPAGAGKLQAEFERLRQQLSAEGWFSSELKQSLPVLASTIGVVTSATGAALQDVLTVLQRRYPVAKVIVYPTPVQGASAAEHIQAALELANQRVETDVLLLVRGGGSIEDLWCFNDIRVATAIRDSRLPVVSGVGHEIDVTIADLVADQRAATPSAAAELVTPNIEQLIADLQAMQRSLAMRWQTVEQRAQERLNQWQARLQTQHPQRRIEQQQQRIDDMERALQQSLARRIERLRLKTQHAVHRLQANSPQRQFASRQQQLHLSQERLVSAWQQSLKQQQNRLALASRGLNAVSPLATLDRGYAIVQDGEKVIREVSELTLGSEVSTRLGDGSFTSKITKTIPSKKSSG